MRRHVCTALALGVLLATGSFGRADEQTEALKIVDAAIQAAGGAAKLDKLKTVTLKGKGMVHAPNEEGTFTVEGTVRGLDRFRLDLDVNINDGMQKLLIVFNSDKGWGKFGDRTEDLPAEAIPLVKAELHAIRMAQMLTPLKDKGIKLSPRGEMKSAGRAGVGIKIVKKALPDVDLYFEKKTHLPMKCELRVKERNAAQEALHEWSFSDF